MLAAILGGANTVWDDLARLKEMRSPDIILAINDAGVVYPHDINFWVTLHPDKLPGWTGRRVENGYSEPQKFVIHRELRPREAKSIFYPPASFVIYNADWGGSSGLFATRFALDAGYEHIVLCGVPMQPEGNHFFTSEPWREAERYHKAWARHVLDLIPRVRSMSGWTMGLLGKPTLSWLKKENPDEIEDQAR